MALLLTSERVNIWWWQQQQPPPPQKTSWRWNTLHAPLAHRQIPLQLLQIIAFIGEKENDVWFRYGNLLIDTSKTTTTDGGKFLKLRPGGKSRKKPGLIDWKFRLLSHFMWKIMHLEYCCQTVEIHVRQERQQLLCGFFFTLIAGRVAVLRDIAEVVPGPSSWAPPAK